MIRNLHLVSGFCVFYLPLIVRILMFCLQGTNEGRIRMKATFIYELSRAAVLFYFYKERNR